MRKIVASELISVDGVIEGPNEWIGPYVDDEVGAWLGEVMATSDTLLLGRVTYHEYIPFWADKSGSEDPVAAHMSKPKYVVSTTLADTDEWADTTLVSGDVAAELDALKTRPGQDIAVSGSAALVRSLLALGLVDELRLLVFPVVVGSGKRLFPDGSAGIPFTLVDSRTSGTGVVSLSYRSAGG